MNIQRRDFVKGGLTALGFLALPGTPMFAAPLGWKTKKKPNLILGILSDTHLMVEWDGVSLYRSMTLDYIRNAFKLFKSRNIDAFLHLGDASHRGGVREWEFHTEVYDSVFGKRGAPPKIFVVGNHELYGDDGHHIRGVYPDPSDPEKRPPKPDSNAPKTACVRVMIPMADGNPNCRVFAYNVVVIGDDPKERYFKSEYFSGVNLGIGHEPNGGVTTVDIPVTELPAGKTLTVAVRPVSSLGTKGKAIGTTFKV